MSELPDAWIWSQYRAIIVETADEPDEEASMTIEDDRVVPIRPTSQKTNRIKYGFLIASSVLVGLFFPWISALLLLLAALLIASGLKPQQTEDFLTSLPAGKIIIEYLSKFDEFLS